MSEAIKSLRSRQNALADSFFQLEVLSKTTHSHDDQASFASKLRVSNLFPLKPIGIDIFQINVGKMCNQVCKHCHVDAGPDRKEIMTRETMELCLRAIRLSGAHTVDITGGAPEMNPDFRWFIEEIYTLGVQKIIVRCNLTIILANKKYHDLPDFFKKHKIVVVSSLPYFSAGRTDAQRGEGVFEKSIQALQMLNKVGYGISDSGLVLDLVYNPSGAFLPSSQMVLEQEFKKKLKANYNISFNQLFAITNLPISRFLEYLIETNNYKGYMDKLIEAFNPIAASEVMCRNTISIGWDGFIYDCDFNQMLDLMVSCPSKHISDFHIDELQSRNIVINQHCYGCTAGAGSSCGGSLS